MAITTTIRWEPDELNEVKSAAKKVGLPVALYLKSLALSKVRGVERLSPYGAAVLLESQKDVKAGHYEQFETTEDFLDSLESSSDEDNQDKAVS